MGLFDIFKSKNKKEDKNKQTISNADSDDKKHDPHGHDSEKEESIKKYAYKFIEKYQITANNLYNGLLKTHPEALRLYNQDHVKLYYIELNNNYFEFNKYLIFTYKKDANMDLDILDLTDDKFYKYDTLYFEKKENDILLEALDGVSIKDIVTSVSVSELTLKFATENDFPTIINNVKSTLVEEAKDFELHNNYPQNYYAKNAARYAYSELDLIPILEKVEDNDFSYQIDQAIAAYDNSLYLASCATLGVCLETICKLLLKNNGVKIKDSDSTLLSTLNDKLRENKLISYKLKGRIDVCYKVRNLAAHTSPGKVVKSDCHFILNTISEIVEEHF